MRLEPLRDGTIQQRLERAKLILSDEKRWARGWYSDGKGGYCLLGASGCNIDHFNSDLCKVLQEAIKSNLGRETTVATFNDRIAVHAQVLDVLDGAITLARSRNI